MPRGWKAGKQMENLLEQVSCHWCRRGSTERGPPLTTTRLGTGRVLSGCVIPVGRQPETSQGRRWLLLERSGYLRHNMPPVGQS